MVRINEDLSIQSAKNYTAENVGVSKNDTKDPLPFVRTDGGPDDLEARKKANNARIKQICQTMKYINDTLAIKPKLPARDAKVIIIPKRGSTVSGLAVEYYCTEQDIYKANPQLKEEGKENQEGKEELRYDRKYIIPTLSEKSKQQYEALLAERKQMNEQLKSLEAELKDLRLDNKNIRAQEIIGEIQVCKRSETFNERYDVSYNKKTGDLILKIKKEGVKLIDIKRDFNLADGVLLEANGEDKLKSFKQSFIRNSEYNQRIAPKNGTLIVPTDKCAPRTK